MSFINGKREEDAWDLGFDMKPNPYPVGSDLHKIYVYAKECREEWEREREWHRRNGHKL